MMSIETYCRWTPRQITNSFACETVIAGAVRREHALATIAASFRASARRRHLANGKETFHEIKARTLELFRHRVVEENWECEFEQVDWDLAHNLLIAKLT